tara:strand:- start:732 stop:1592 length:861 start_codon:yes stop_codon:yes gene_type:complete
MSEAIAAVKQDVKAVSMKYKKDRTDEQEELKRLEEERANVVQEQKDAEADKAETESLAPEEKTFKKRYGDLRRHSQQKEQELKDKIRDLEGQISTATKEAIKLPKSDDELAAWTKEYPDVAKVIETIATKKALELDKGMEDRLKAIAEKEAEAKRMTAESQLLQLHPDFEDIRNDEEFHGWVERQPSWVQKALYENETDARSAARAIDLYKVDMKIADTKKEKSDKGAASLVTAKNTSNIAKTKSSQSNQWRESQVAKMKAHEYEKNEKAIDEAIKSGNFIYDLQR